MFTIVLNIDGEEYFDDFREFYSWNAAKSVAIDDVRCLAEAGFEASYEIRCNVAF